MFSREKAIAKNDHPISITYYSHWKQGLCLLIWSGPNNIFFVQTNLAGGKVKNCLVWGWWWGALGREADSLHEKLLFFYPTATHLRESLGLY